MPTNSGRNSLEPQQWDLEVGFISEHSSGLDAQRAGLLPCYTQQAGNVFVGLCRGRRGLCLSPDAQSCPRQGE